MRFLNLTLVIIFSILLAFPALCQARSLDIGISGSDDSHSHSLSLLFPLDSINGTLKADHVYNNIKDENTHSTEVYADGGVPISFLTLRAFSEYETSTDIGKKVRIGWHIEPISYSQGDIDFSVSAGTYQVIALGETDLDDEEDHHLSILATAETHGVTLTGEYRPGFKTLDVSEWEVDASYLLNLNKSVQVGLTGEIKDDGNMLHRRYSAVTRINF